MPMKVRIEFTVSDDADPSTILEAVQELAIELNEQEDDELSETDKEAIRNDVTLEILPD